MSSVLAKINAINKASTDAIPSILSSISETLENNLLSEEEMQKLCNAIIRLVNSSPPAITRAALSMSDQILSKKYPPNFPLDLFNSLKSPLSSSNKQLRSTLIDIAIKCFLASYPSDFWGRFGDLFSQTPILKEIGLDLFMKTITEYPDYEINELIPKVFSCLSDSSSTVRSKTYEIVTLLYAKNPKSIEKRIKKQFPNDFNDILKRISGNTKVTKKGSYVEESSKASLSPEEIERSLREEFKNACSDINPKMGFCKFSQVGNSLKRTSEWKDRMKALQTLVSFAKSSPKPDTFVNGFKSICDDYISCLCDARSTLSKYACLTLVAMARCLKSALDQISDRLIPPLLGRTTHGTLVISLSSEIAVIEYVTAICGKKIKKVLEDNVDSNSVEIRITVVKSILVARKVWKPSYTKGFDEIIQQKKHDPSPIVRQLVENNQFESPKKRVPFQELNEIYETPRMKEPEKRFNEGETFDFTSLQTENKPQKAIESKIAYKPQKIIEPQTFSSEMDFSFLQNAIESRNIENIVNLLKENRPELYGHMQNIIDILIVSMNDENAIELSSQLCTILCDKYRKEFFPFLNQILFDLPEDNYYGNCILTKISETYGQLQIAILLRNSHLSYCIGFCLTVSERNPTNLILLSSSIFNAITNNFYERFKTQIHILLKILFETDEKKCESLISSLQFNERETILWNIQKEIPQLYNLYYGTEINILNEKLLNELENVKNGNEINFETLDLAKDSFVLLTITILRESINIKNSEEVIHRLLNYSVNNDLIIVSAAENALKKRAENNLIDFNVLLSSSIMSNAYFKTLIIVLKLMENKNEIWGKKEIIKKKLEIGINEITSKYAALSVIAELGNMFGEIGLNEFGNNLSMINKQIVKSMMKKSI